MANVRYSYGNEQFLRGQIDWLTDTIKAVLVDTNRYAVAPDVDQHLVDIPTVARIATSAALSGKTALNGVARAADLTIATVQGQTVQAVVLYRDTTDETTSELIAFLDTGVGLPYTPQGTTAVIHWDSGPNGIFKL